MVHEGKDTGLVRVWVPLSHAAGWGRRGGGDGGWVENKHMGEIYKDGYCSTQQSYIHNPVVCVCVSRLAFLNGAK